jgi:hypothetical protein
VLLRCNCVLQVWTVCRRVPKRTPSTFANGPHSTDQMRTTWRGQRTASARLRFQHQRHGGRGGGSRWFTVVVTMGAADGDVSGACDGSMAGCRGRLWEFVTQSTKNVPGSNLPADPSRRGSGCREAAHGSHPLHKSARSLRRCPRCHRPPAAPGSAAPVCPQPRQVLCGHTGGRQRTSAFVYGSAPTAAP